MRCYCIWNSLEINSRGDIWKKEFGVLLMKCQPQTLKFLKHTKSEQFLERVGHISWKPSQQGSWKNTQAPRKKSLRQVLVLIHPYLLARLDATLTFLCPYTGKEKVLPQHLSWDLVPVRIQSFSGGVSHHLGNRGTRLSGIVLGQEHSRNPSLMEFGHLPQVFTSIGVCSLTMSSRSHI